MHVSLSNPLDIHIIAVLWGTHIELAGLMAVYINVEFTWESMVDVGETVYSHSNSCNHNVCSVQNLPDLSIIIKLLTKKLQTYIPVQRSTSTLVQG